MPFDVLGCTRATMMDSRSLIDGEGAFRRTLFADEPSSKEWGNLRNVHQAGDRSLELLVLNEEFLVSISHQLMLITSLPFVHTARRSYRLDDPVKMLEAPQLAGVENI